MGRIEPLTNPKTTSAMDIDPRPTSWNSLCPTFIDPRRTKLLQQEPSGHVIGSPPPSAAPKTQWNENFDMPNQRAAPGDATSELSSRVQDIRLQPPQPMIICETVEDVKVDANAGGASSSVSLAVPAVDLSNEKKRPPY